MQSSKDSILVINAGSSSIKFALYKNLKLPVLAFRGEMERIGMANTKIIFVQATDNQKKSLDVHCPDYSTAMEFLIGWLEKQEGFGAIGIIGHRIVQGMSHAQPELVTQELLDELKQWFAYDPEHLPWEIKLIEIFRQHDPELKQIACFDTSFHSSMPAVAKMLAIPRRFRKDGIQRYGFHGISYSFLMEELERIAGNKVGKGKLILAHLGNGASLAAVKDGQCVDTSMGFTPASGLVMGSRTGDLDPGVAWYLIKSGKLTSGQFNHLINHESGLLGVSETSSDMRELLGIQGSDNRAAEAIELFCYQTRKWIGSFAAVLEGVDTLIFSGGIGENAPEIRERICAGLQFLGIELDKTRNENNGEVISSDSGRLTVRVIKTNEELMIAKSADRLLHSSTKMDYHGNTANR